MKKILLVGQLGEIVRSINDGLLREFSVQICSEQIEMVQSMAKIVKPDMFIFCQIGIHELDVAFFEWVREKYPQIPVLVISTEDDWREISKYCNGVQFEKFFRPVTIHAISEKCKELTSSKLIISKEKLEDDSEDQTETGIIKPVTGKKVIMVVDDNPIVLRNVKSILDEKYETIVVPSGEKALLLIPKKRPDLVLLDYEMKGIDGRETFEAMLNDEYMSKIPVIFLTSVSSKDMVLDVLKSKPAGYILKPIDKERLFDEIIKVTEYV